MSLSVSKQLVPLANKPIIGWVLEQLAAAGVKRVHIVVGPHNREQIEEYSSSTRCFQTLGASSPSFGSGGST
nr:sugar phosphate nucleotidyltransferase [Pyrobaculum arsenaticum]